MKKYRQQYQKGFMAVVIIIAVIAVIGFGGWYVWHSQQSKSQNQITSISSAGAHTDNDQSIASVDTRFKITELGVEFEVKDDITPLYFVQNWSPTGVNYKLIRFSTQQLVNKGQVQGSANPCQFHTDNFTDADHSLLNVAVYNSQADLLKANSANPKVTADNIKPENGYITTAGRIFVVPQSVQSGSGACLEDATFESQQWVSLQQSLMTLRAIQ